MWYNAWARIIRNYLTNFTEFWAVPKHITLPLSWTRRHEAAQWLSVHWLTGGVEAGRFPEVCTPLWGQKCTVQDWTRHTSSTAWPPPPGLRQTSSTAWPPPPGLPHLTPQYCTAKDTQQQKSSQRKNNEDLHPHPGGLWQLGLWPQKQASWLPEELELTKYKYYVNPSSSIVQLCP